MYNLLAVWCVALATWGVTVVDLTSTTSTHPSIIWNPWNPMFACDEPKINVRIGDILNFVCPSDELTFYVPSTSIALVYENLYFLGTRRDLYNACDATGMTQLLRCNGDQPKHTTLTFRDFAMSKGSITFERGKTYYFIGTGFRTKENLDGTTNGSCQLTDEQGKYRMRLQIHVCADDDAGCLICKTTACYYKNCGRTTCSLWFSIGPIYLNITNCFQIQRRTCKNHLTEQAWHETTYDYVVCTLSNNRSTCTQWISTGYLYYDNNAMQCYAVETRACMHVGASDKINYNENNYRSVPCPQGLRVCSNVTSKFLLPGKCHPSGSQYCHLVLGGTIPWKTYTPCDLNSIVQPTKSMVDGLGTSSLQGHVSSFIDVMSGSSIYASPSVVSATSATSSRGCTGSGLVSDTFIDYEKEYQQSHGNGKDSSLKDRLILGLAVSVGLAFIIGVMLGSFTVKYLENRHRCAKVQDKGIVVPGTVATFTNTGYDNTHGPFDNLDADI